MRDDHPSRRYMSASFASICGVVLVGLMIFLFFAAQFLGFSLSMIAPFWDGGSNWLAVVLFTLLAGFVVISAGLLIGKVVFDRLTNGEDNYYSRNVER